MPASKTFRRARLIVVLLVLLLVAAVAAGGWWAAGTVRASYPQTSGEVRLPGMSAPAEVVRDANGIPQIYADTAEDLFRAQGYVHAQDRFWEMDVRRHITSGRLSEMFGEDQVETDAFLRTLGMQRVAQQEVEETLSDDTVRNLEAYAAGVNAYLEAHSGSDLSLEYALLGFTNRDYEPEPWTATDSVAWLKAMAWDLRGNMQQEIDRALLSASYTPAEIDALYPGYDYSTHPSIVAGGSVDGDGGSFTPEDGDAADATDPQDAPDSSAAAAPAEDATEQPAPGASDGPASSDGPTSGESGQPASTEESSPAGDAGAEPAGDAATGLSALSSTGALTSTTNTTTSTTSTSAEEGAGGWNPLTGTLRALERITDVSAGGAQSVGSNSWVVAGEHTTSGRPLLANDPHLAPSMPSVWYQVGLHCREVGQACPYDVSGYSLAGVPGVVIGHNQSIAWGMTNLAADVTDLYLEQITDTTYLYDGEQVEFDEVRQETIEVAGGDDRTITVRSTVNGPLLSDRSEELRRVGQDAPAPDSAPDRRDGYAVSLKWTALTPGTTMDALFAVDRATDFEEFRAAAEAFDAPAQNMIYADVEGNIGYQTPGTIPVRGQGDGTYPSPGWDPAYQWTGTIPFEDLPYEYNPERGFIVTANNPVIASPSEDYPYLLTADWAYGARAERITDMIQRKIDAGTPIGAEDMQAMQNDTVNEMAATLVPYLLDIPVEEPEPYVGEAQDLLRDWDHTQDADSAAAAYYNAVWRNLLLRVFSDKFPASLRSEDECPLVIPDTAGAPGDELSGEALPVNECGLRDPLSAAPDGGDRWYAVVAALLEQPDSPWWDIDVDPSVTTDRDAALAQALQDARYELTARIGKNIEDWSWGRLHALDLENQTLGVSGLTPVESLLNRGPYEVGGGSAAVNATGWNAAAGYATNWVPSMRMVVDLSDLDISRWINVTGASGHAFHDNYDDQTALWQEGRLLAWPFTEQAVGAVARDRLTLTP
ncbi:penicillin acylase family protein [Allostreptomyces psammosilenae]|uniref:Penicillin amidase n=1 Tax=Allostreptomyces psammosilenae TaxID=1892865 RepID=A0A852ZZK9_9ACTN|nr:penicillin acylase family protein [Allostreptomyces psammosilenae]NYI07776.1 penicillin amidase [Allostreptomyces psammosilenae]